MSADLASLFESCRRGDLARVRYLVEERDVELNVRDQWDSTPLYYSCLCGHEDLVRYLLQRGATCQASTFDGERCVYGALTDGIRAMLLDSRVVTAHSWRRDAYSEFLMRTAFGAAVHADVCFALCDGSNFSAHRCVLMARSPYFRRNFAGKWSGRRQVSVRSASIEADSFRALLQYLYTGRVEIRLDRLDGLLKLASKTELKGLLACLRQRVSGVDGLRAAKPGLRATTLVLDPDMEQVSNDLTLLAKLAIPGQLWPAGERVANAGELAMEEQLDCYPDLVLEADAADGNASWQFRCHRLFACGRSEYFRAAADSELSEGRWLPDGTRHLRLRCLNADELVSVLAYVYSDRLVLTDNGESDGEAGNGEAYYLKILSLISAADLLLLPGLKRLCAGRLENCLSADNIVQLLRLARLMRLPRLEGRCAEFGARHLAEVLPRPDFRLLVMEDAASVRNRQEADTIDIIDQLRSRLPRGSAELHQAIDRCLDELGLEA